MYIYIYKYKKITVNLKQYRVLTSTEIYHSTNQTGTSSSTRLTPLRLLHDNCSFNYILFFLEKLMWRPSVKIKIGLQAIFPPLTFVHLNINKNLRGH